MLGICSAFLLIFGTLILQEYMANHTYYYDMLKNSSNIYIILATLICAAIPVCYILYWKWATMKWFAWSTWIGLVLYGIIYASIRENILGTGAVMRAINTTILFWMTIFIALAIVSLWSWAYKKIYGDVVLSRRGILLTFGLGFWIFVVANYFLILANIYYPIVNWIQVWLLCYLIWISKKQLQEIGLFFSKNIAELHVGKKYSTFQWIIALLFLVSIAYYFIGFKLSYIPYPTAWDANHAYMLIPNSITSHFGHIWNSSQWISYMPVYLSFVSFFFSIIKGLWNAFWISPDTFGVEMNFLTAIFTFITTLWIIDKIMDLVSHKDTNHKALSMSLGWFSKILWLTSWMGAFLVFVDNKSDFGIMYLSCLGLFSWLWYIDYIIKKYNQDKDDDISRKEWLSDLYLSWIFFAIAVTSKVTALFDAMNFILLIVGFILGGVVLLWLAFIIMGALAYLGLNGVSNFISKPFASIAWFWGGTLISLLWLAKWQKKYSYSYWPRLTGILKNIAMWWLAFILTIIVLKLPIGLARLYNGETDVLKLPKEMILWKNQEQKKFVLLASNNLSQLRLAQFDSVNLGEDTNTLWETLWKQATGTTTTTTKTTPPVIKQLTVDQCNLAAVGLTDVKELYKSLLKAPWDGYSEDVGRYVWFGQKEFSNSWRSFLVPANSCISINGWAAALCRNKDLITSLTEANAKTLLSKVKKNWDTYQLLNSIITWFSDTNKLSTFVTDSQKLLNDYRKDKVITKEWWKVYIPFKIITPLNVTFNRSLQNLSSYYTDIGIIWLILQFFIIMGFFYGLRSGNRLLWTTNFVAIIGWLFWIVIWWGIVWYGIGLITWTIMWFVLFIHDLYIPDRDKETHVVNHFLYYLFIWLFLIFWIIQLSLNFVRIASQWGSWPFLQYRYSNGQELQIDENLQQKVTVKFPYRWTDILNLQFPHYNKILNAINTQTWTEINLIAWTYAQYRVKEQARLVSDGLLGGLWITFSDRDPCKTYLRLKDKNYKYMIIDPNIASIVMGGWNSSLMDRFFAKMDPTGAIVTDGTMSMLGKLANAGYLSVYSTNNLWAKYGFWLSSDYLKNKLSITSDSDLALARARLATARFWWNQQQLIAVLTQIFTERVSNGLAISDIADVYGKIIDEEKLSLLVKNATASWFPSIQTSIKDLTQDERFVLLNYLNILTSYNKQPAQFGSIASNIITQSLWGWSQLIVFEVK